MGRDPHLTDVVASGVALGRPEADHTVQVAVDGLAPRTTYWYGFKVVGPEGGPVRSPTGRTRTAPVASVDRLRIGVVCCAHWQTGYFNAYGRLAERDVDLVVHLGDYLYEDNALKERGDRRHDPAGRIATLAGYRARYAQYRTDPDLQRLHRRHPVVAVWDDHELAGNAWRDGAARHDPKTDGPWPARRAAAEQAYREWVPARWPDPSDPSRLWRQVPFGPSLDLLVLDTRLHGRDEPAAGHRSVVGIHRRGRSLLGEAQRAWLAERLGPRAVASTPAGEAPARWTLVLSQVVVAPIHLLAVPPRLRRPLGAVGGGIIVNPGQWDGYPDERTRLLRLLAGRPGDVVVVSGDLHSSWAAQLEPEDGGPPVAAEVVAPAVSAPSFARALAPPVQGGRRLLEWAIRRSNPHVRYVDTAGHGYLLLDVTAGHVDAEWWHVDTKLRRAPGEHLAARWRVLHGDPVLRPA